MQKRHVQAAGGVPLVLAALRAHAASAELVECGCKAVHNLVCNSDAIRAEMVAQGAVHIVCEGLRQHGESPQVQMEGSVCLASLAKDDERVKQQVAVR
eukprot:3930814-Prymnesium_polylepis.1